jgi:colicin import membrane protein
LRIASADKKQTAAPAQTSFHVEKPEVERESKEVIPPEPPANPGTALAVLIPLSSIVPTEFFKPNGSDAILATLEKIVLEQRAKLDISTEAGRAGIASLNRKVASSKTALDGLRKDLVADQKEALKAIDKEGAIVWDRIEALQKLVTQELDDYKAANALRIAAHEAELQAVVDIEFMASTRDVAGIEASIAAVKAKAARPWEEFKSRADFTISGALCRMEETLEKTKRAAAEAAELKRLRVQEAERKHSERLQEIADYAAAEERRKADLRAEQARKAAEAERQRIENERIEAEARAKQAEAQRIAAEQKAEADRVAEAARVERERIDAQERAAQALLEAEQQRQREAEWAEQKRIAAEKETARQLQLAEQRAREAAEQAERDKQAAIEAERKRVADEAERVRLETEKRERNKKHRRVIEDAAVISIQLISDMPEELARVLVEAISAGRIDHVTINY